MFTSSIPLPVGTPSPIITLASMTGIMTTGTREAEFGDPISMLVWYQNFLYRMYNMNNGKGMPFTPIIYNPLSNYSMLSAPTNEIILFLRVKWEDSQEFYDSYVYYGVEVEDYYRIHNQNKDMYLNSIWTNNYQEDKNSAYPTKGDGGE